MCGRAGRPPLRNGSIYSSALSFTLALPKLFHFIVLFVSIPKRKEFDYIYVCVLSYLFHIFKFLCPNAFFLFLITSINYLPRLIKFLLTRVYLFFYVSVNCNTIFLAVEEKYKFLLGATYLSVNHLSE